MVKQALIFMLGGLLSAIADIAVTRLLLGAGVWYFAAISLGFLCALCVNLGYHLKVTFSIALSRQIAGKYLVIVFANYLLTVLIVELVRQIDSNAVMMGKIVSLPIVALHGYAWSKLWVFKAS